jgi:hypothetical protein
VAELPDDRDWFQPVDCCNRSGRHFATALWRFATVNDTRLGLVLSVARRFSQMQRQRVPDAAGGRPLTVVLRSNH